MAMLRMKLHKPVALQEDNLKIKQKALKHTEADNILNLSHSTNSSYFFQAHTDLSQCI